jgi:hypothetical protein
MEILRNVTIRYRRINSISRGVRRWLMANPGSDPRFVENRIDVCPKKHLSV